MGSLGIHVCTIKMHTHTQTHTGKGDVDIFSLGYWAVQLNVGILGLKDSFVDAENELTFRTRLAFNTGKTRWDCPQPIRQNELENYDTDKCLEAKLQ